MTVEPTIAYTPIMSDSHLMGWPSPVHQSPAQIYTYHIYIVLLLVRPSPVYQSPAPIYTCHIYIGLYIQLGPTLAQVLGPTPCIIAFFVISYVRFGSILRGLDLLARSSNQLLRSFLRYGSSNHYIAFVQVTFAPYWTTKQTLANMLVQHWLC
jgi:hypothetical protein